MSYNQKQPVQVEFNRLPWDEQVSEVFYKRALELTKVAYHAVNRAYPIEERRRDSKAQDLYEEAQRLAKHYLYQAKGAVRGGLLPFAVVIRHDKPYDYSQDKSTQQFRGGLEVQLYTLKKRLVDYADLLVPKGQQVTYLTTLDKVYETEVDNLLNGAPPIGMAYYEIAPKYTSAEQLIPKEPMINLNDHIRIPTAAK